MTADIGHLGTPEPASSLSREEKIQAQADQVIAAALDKLLEGIGGPLTFAAFDSPVGATQETWERYVKEFRGAVCAVLRFPHWLALNRAEAAREAAAAAAERDAS